MSNSFDEQMRAIVSQRFASEEREDGMIERGPRLLTRLLYDKFMAERAHRLLRRAFRALDQNYQAFLHARTGFIRAQLFQQKRLKAFLFKLLSENRGAQVLRSAIRALAHDHFKRHLRRKSFIDFRERITKLRAQRARIERAWQWRTARVLRPAFIALKIYAEAKRQARGVRDSMALFYNIGLRRRVFDNLRLKVRASASVARRLASTKRLGILSRTFGSLREAVRRVQKANADRVERIKSWSRGRSFGHWRRCLAIAVKFLRPPGLMRLTGLCALILPVSVQRGSPILKSKLLRRCFDALKEPLDRHRKAMVQFRRNRLRAYIRAFQKACSARRGKTVIAVLLRRMIACRTMGRYLTLMKEESARRLRLKLAVFEMGLRCKQTALARWVKAARLANYCSILWHRLDRLLLKRWWERLKEQREQIARSVPARAPKRIGHILLTRAFKALRRLAERARGVRNCQLRNKAGLKRRCWRSFRAFVLAGKELNSERINMIRNSQKARVFRKWALHCNEQIERRVNGLKALATFIREDEWRQMTEAYGLIKLLAAFNRLTKVVARRTARLAVSRLVSHWRFSEATERILAREKRRIYLHSWRTRAEAHKVKRKALASLLTQLKLKAAFNGLKLRVTRQRELKDRYGGYNERRAHDKLATCFRIWRQLWVLQLGLACLRQRQVGILRRRVFLCWRDQAKRATRMRLIRAQIVQKVRTRRLLLFFRLLSKVFCRGALRRKFSQRLEANRRTTFFATWIARHRERVSDRGRQPPLSWQSVQDESEKEKVIVDALQLEKAHTPETKPLQAEGLSKLQSLSSKLSRLHYVATAADIIQSTWRIINQRAALQLIRDTCLDEQVSLSWSARRGQILKAAAFSSLRAHTTAQKAHKDRLMLFKGQIEGVLLTNLFSEWARMAQKLDSAESCQREGSLHSSVALPQADCLQIDRLEIPYPSLQPLSNKEIEIGLERLGRLLNGRLRGSVLDKLRAVAYTNTLKVCKDIISHRLIDRLLRDALRRWRARVEDAGTQRAKFEAIRHRTLLLTYFGKLTNAAKRQKGARVSFMRLGLDLHARFYRSAIIRGLKELAGARTKLQQLFNSARRRLMLVTLQQFLSHCRAILDDDKRAATALLQKRALTALRTYAEFRKRRYRAFLLLEHRACLGLTARVFAGWKNLAVTRPASLLNIGRRVQAYRRLKLGLKVLRALLSLLSSPQANGISG